MAEVIEIGDYVEDPLDDNRLRKVIGVENKTTLYLSDGGVMGIEEIGQVYLPSEIEG